MSHPPPGLTHRRRSRMPRPPRPARRALTALTAWLTLAAAPSVLAAQGGTAAREVPGAGDDFARARRTFLANRVDEAYALLAAAVRARPDDAARHAWYADAARRLGEVTTARAEASEAVRLDACQSVAHEVLGMLWDPQFNRDGATSTDSARAHYERAVACDPRNGSSWMHLWGQALRRNDAPGERRALAGLERSAMIPSAWTAHARWVLTTLPKDAIAISAGDIDTYPPVMLQALQRLRPDVAIVNRSLFNVPEVARTLVARHRLPLPKGLTADSLADAAERIIAFWRVEAAAGRLGRPLAVLHSNGEPGPGPGTALLAGPFWLVTPGPARIDVRAVEEALRVAGRLDWSGPSVAPHDRSPLRQAAQGAPAMMVGYLVAFEAQALGRQTPGREPWLRDFFTRAGTADASAQSVWQWIRQFPAGP